MKRKAQPQVLIPLRLLRVLRERRSGGGSSGDTVYPAKSGAYSQNFNAVADGTMLRNVSGWGAFNSGGATTPANDYDFWRVSGGQVVGTGSYTVSAPIGPFLTGYDAGSANHVFRLTYRGAVGGSIRLCVASTHQQNAVYLAWSVGAGTGNISKVDSTGTVSLGSWAWSAVDLGREPASGDEIELTVYGQRVYLKINGFWITPAGGYDLDTTRAFTKGTRVGFAAYDIDTTTQCKFDDVYVAALSASVEHASTSLEWANLANDGTSNVAGSFPIFWPGQIGSGRSVRLAGTYSGTVQDLDYRVVNATTGTQIQGWQRVATANRTISGGSWTANVQVPMCDTTTNPRVRVDVRAANDVDAGARTPATCVGLLVMSDGQSNSVYRDAGTGSSLATAYARNNAYVWSSQQAKVWRGGVTSASETAPGFMYAHELAAITGIPCGLFVAGVGAQPIDKLIASDSTYQNGVGSSGVFWDDLLTEANSKQCNGYGYVSYTDWTQGEAEAEGTGALTGSDVTAYRADFDTLLSQLRGGVMVSSTAPVGVCIIGQAAYNKGAGATIGNANWSLIRQTLFGLTDKTNVRVSASLVDLAHPTGDTLHYSGNSYKEANRRGAHTAAVALGYSTYDGRGPYITGATRSGATITLAVNLNGATSISGTGLTNYEVSTDDFATTKTISSVGVSSGNIVITLSADPGAAVKVRSFAGSWPESVTGAVNPQDITSTRATGSYSDGTTIPVEPIYVPITSN